MNYTNFQKYPIQISNINESDNNEITAIEELVIKEIAYSGNADDIVDLLPYFVFFKFCEGRFSEVSSSEGEQQKVAEFTTPSMYSMIKAWNIGSAKLLTICTDNETTANEKYQSQIRLI